MPCWLMSEMASDSRAAGKGQKCGCLLGQLSRLHTSNRGAAGAKSLLKEKKTDTPPLTSFQTSVARCVTDERMVCHRHSFRVFYTAS